MKGRSESSAGAGLALSEWLGNHRDNAPLHEEGKRFEQEREIPDAHQRLEYWLAIDDFSDPASSRSGGSFAADPKSDVTAAYRSRRQN